MSVQYQTSVVQFPQWVIYKHPEDFPEHYVARLWDGMSGMPTTSYLLAPDLARLYLRLPPDLVCMPRHPGDDPKIVEVWL